MTWTATLYRDGQPVCEAMPCSDYSAAEVLAPFVAGWLGGPVSIVSAVVANRPPAVAPQASLFDEEPVS